MVPNNTPFRILGIAFLGIVATAAYAQPAALGDDFRYKDHTALIHQVAEKSSCDGSAHQSWAYYLAKPHPSVLTLRNWFADAADEFGVPQELLEVIAQVETNWTHIGPGIDHGWGIMHLVQNSYCDTLGEAARLLGAEEELLKEDARTNIRGAAALLAEYAGDKQQSFEVLEDWFDAVKRVSGLATDELRAMQAELYYQTLQKGVRSTTLWDETVDIAPHPTVDISVKLTRGDRHEESDNQESLLNTLSGVPDGDQGTVVASPDYGPAIENLAPSCNYWSGRNHVIDTWVNHWVGVGTYAGAISWFHNCSSQVSAHFVIRASDGQITQVVRVANTAWHAGATGYPYNNSRSIGVEHEATVTNPALWNSEPMLNASATMARHFCNLYGIPKVRALPGIRGHNEMPGTSTQCPGPLPWSTWMGKLTQPDLTVLEPVVMSPTTTVPGGTIRVDWTEKNAGQAASSPAHNTKVFLSTSAYGTTYQIGYYGMYTLGVGSTQSYYANIVVPASIPSGVYYVTVYIDSDSYVSEANENNNIGSSSPNKITVCAGGCLINGVCYSNGTVNPNNACQFCNSSVNQTAWSNRPSGTTCGNSNASECDAQDTCDGSGTCINRVKPGGTVCRPATGECDVAETCNGSSTTCPVNGFRTNGTPCPDDLYCNGNETCQDGECIALVEPCSAEEWCDEENDKCLGGCPAGPVTFVNPPSGMVDARQPHPPDDAANRQNLKTFTVDAPAGAADNWAACWSLCESVVQGAPNGIAGVVDDGGGHYTVTLERPMSFGAITTITYTDDLNTVHRGVFISHPANVNADSASAPADILRIIDCLNNVAFCEIWQCDVDRSAVCGPPDILRVIDLLNGAGAYDPWLNSPKPVCNATNCCP